MLLPTGPKTDRATAMRNKAYDSDKMENELEMQKANKTKVSSAEEVGGRKGKGTLTGVLEKISRLLLRSFWLFPCVLLGWGMLMVCSAG